MVMRATRAAGVVLKARWERWRRGEVVVVVRRRRRDDVRKDILGGWMCGMWDCERVVRGLWVMGEFGRARRRVRMALEGVGQSEAGAQGGAAFLGRLGGIDDRRTFGVMLWKGINSLSKEVP